MTYLYALRCAFRSIIAAGFPTTLLCSAPLLLPFLSGLYWNSGQRPYLSPWEYMEQDPLFLMSILPMLNGLKPSTSFSVLSASSSPFINMVWQWKLHKYPVYLRTQVQFPRSVGLSLPVVFPAWYCDLRIRYRHVCMPQCFKFYIEFGWRMFPNKNCGKSRLDTMLFYKYFYIFLYSGLNVLGDLSPIYDLGSGNLRKRFHQCPHSYGIGNWLHRSQKGPLTSWSR